MAYPPHTSCYVVRTFFFFHENLHSVVVVLDYRHVYQKSCYSAHKLAFLSSRLVPVSVGRTMAPWLPILGCRAWAGGAQVCLQNTLYALSQTLERLSRGTNCSRESRLFLAYTGEAIRDKTVTCPLQRRMIFLIKHIQPCFLCCTGRVEHSTAREH